MCTKTSTLHHEERDSYSFCQCLSFFVALNFEQLGRSGITFYAVAELRKILKNKKLLLIGDSLMTEFYFGLAELLQVKANESRYDCRMNFTIHPGNNGTLMHLKACVIVVTGYESFVRWDKSRVIPEEKIRRAIADYDVILFNQGLHYDKLTLMCQSAVYFNNLGKMLYGKNFFKNFGPNLSFSWGHW